MKGEEWNIIYTYLYTYIMCIFKNMNLYINKKYL